AVARTERANRRNDDLGRDCDRGNRGRRCNRAVVDDLRRGRAPWVVREEAALLVVEDLYRVRRSVAGAESPDLAVVAAPAHRISTRIFALRIRGTAAVLEVVDALLPHEGILDAAKVDPHVRVLMSEHRSERE